MNFEDKVVIITGAGSGIGRELARKLLAEGARVVLAGRRLDKLQESITGSAQPARATAVVTDVSQLSDLRALVGTAVKVHGHIDVVINNAGIGYSGGIESVRPAEVEHLMKVNTVSPIWLTQLAVPLLRQRPEAMLVYVSSLAALVPIPYQAFYCASKFGLHGFSHSVRRELQGTRIKVVTVYPGNIESELISSEVRRHMEEIKFRMRHVATARRAAEVIVRGMHHEAPMIYVANRTERTITRLNRVIPALVDKVMYRNRAKIQSTLAIATDWTRSRNPEVSKRTTDLDDGHDGSVEVELGGVTTADGQAQGPTPPRR